MRIPGYWDLYNTEICILTEPAHLVPDYIENRHSHKAFSRLCKGRDGEKWSKRNEVIGNFLDSGRRSIHTAVDPFPLLLAWRTTEWRLRVEPWGRRLRERNMEQKSPSHKIAAVRNICLWFSFYLYPFHFMELLLTYWIYYWLPQEKGKLESGSLHLGMKPSVSDKAEGQSLGLLELVLWFS